MMMVVEDRPDEKSYYDVDFIEITNDGIGDAPLKLAEDFQIFELDCKNNPLLLSQWVNICTK